MILRELEHHQEMERIDHQYYYIKLFLAAKEFQLVREDIECQHNQIHSMLTKVFNARVTIDVGGKNVDGNFGDNKMFGRTWESAADYPHVVIGNQHYKMSHTLRCQQNENVSNITVLSPK